jgi:GAF domain-containing protein
VHDSVLASLFLGLLGDLAAAVEPRAAVSSVLASTRDALGAQAVSLFLVDADLRELRGAPGEWDWTRTSFTVPLAEWPSVGRALAHGTPIHMTVIEASGAEAGWFERRGIGATFCVPIHAAGRAIGVLFFDFTAAVAAPDEAAVRFAEAVAAACGVALERAFRSEAEVERRHSVEHALQDREQFIADVAARLAQTLVDVTASARPRCSAEMGGGKSADSMSDLDRRVEADLELLSALRERRWERAAALLADL